MSQMFLDTVHFSPRRHFGVVLDAEGFILARTPMFRTAKQAIDAARVLRDDINTACDTAREAFRISREARKGATERPAWDGTAEHARILNAKKES